MTSTPLTTKPRAWKKLGKIYQPVGDKPWSRSHAQLPMVQPINDQWRIYFATRNEQGRSNISYLETPVGDPLAICYLHDDVLLPLGDLGTFDESGIMPLSLVRRADGIFFLYYAGWTQRKTIPYHNSIGLAISDDGCQSFRKAYRGPVLDARLDEPFFTGTAHVRIENDTWRMWYQSCTGWIRTESGVEPLYHIKYAESRDGIHWERNGVIAIDYRDSREGGICNATINATGHGFEMWYCYRKAEDYRANPANSYRIGYALSRDGIVWERQDDRAGIEVSGQGWDSQMIAYPHFLSHDGKDYLFYNGNGFGASGFGVATCEVIIDA